MTEVTFEPDFEQVCVRGERPLGMLIRISSETTQPMVGTPVTGAGEPAPFDGWLDLLRVPSELVAAADGENRQVTDSSVQATETSNWH